MVQPIGSFASPRIAPEKPSSGGLEAELSRLQAALADCVNCATARTNEGKAKIQEVTNKINSIKARMEKLSQAKPVEQPPRANENKASGSPSLGSLLDLST